MGKIVAIGGGENGRGGSIRMKPAHLTGKL